jgi:phospholipase/carboxylesterase
MNNAAGLSYVEMSSPGSDDLAPLILFHGSGRREDDLVDFAAAAAPARRVIAVRGGVPHDGGFAFFRRNPDRSLDQGEVGRAAIQLADFVRIVGRAGGRAPVLVGYSNGAIAAAALLAAAPGECAGAVLMRPLSAFPDAIPADLSGHSALLIAGAHDDRRAPGDVLLLEAQLRAAGADVSAHVLDCGHGWDPAGGDVELTRSWLGRLG